VYFTGYSKALINNVIIKKMKQKIYILGVVTAMILSAGAILKVNHWPGAAILLIVGTILLVLLFIPAALINNFKVEGNSKNRILYIVTGITCFVIFTTMLYKIMHWPHAGVGLLIALPFPYIVFLPVFLVVTSKNKNFNVYNTVFVLLLLAMNSVFATLLALNVSKETIIDSYNISKNYNKVGEALVQFPLPGKESAINLKIDEIIKITNDYQDLILSHEGMTREQWEKDPGNLLKPDSPNIAAAALYENGETNPGSKLEKNINELIVLMQQTKGYEKTAKALPAILGLEKAKGEDSVLTFLSYRNIMNNLTWALIYLDGVETDLLMIRASSI
jgi:hypothetical protein